MSGCEHEDARIRQFWAEATDGSLFCDAYLVQRVAPRLVDIFFLKCRRRYLSSGPEKRRLFVERLNQIFRGTLGRFGDRLKAEIEVMP